MTSTSSRSVLIVAYHIPPFTGSSGVQRTVKFCQYLRDHDWQPVVLTVEPRAYCKVSSDDSLKLPEDVPVYRSFCLDAARHLSFKGRYPGVIALPDRWASWWPSGMLTGSKAIRDWRPSVVWSTYPIATAHLVAGTLARVYKLPWVADFRDWMTHADYPAGRLQRMSYRRLERYVLRNAAAASFTTDSCLSLYREKFPDLPASNWFTLPNGYDESDFKRFVPAAIAKKSDCIHLLHSGYLYPEERDPSDLFKAIALLKKGGFFEGRKLKVRFRGAGNERQIAEKASVAGVKDMVDVLPHCSHEHALVEMQQASALLLIQGRRFDRQIPAKAYEYLRCGRPVLTLASSSSESARLMSVDGFRYCADPRSPNEIAIAIERLVHDIETNQIRLASPSQIRRFDRRRQTSLLAQVFDSVAADNSLLVRT